MLTQVAQQMRTGAKAGREAEIAVLGVPVLFWSPAITCGGGGDRHTGPQEGQADWPCSLCTLRSSPETKVSITLLLVSVLENQASSPSLHTTTPQSAGLQREP